MTVMKKPHKDNQRNSTLNTNWMLVKCHQLLLMAYQRSKGKIMQSNRYRKCFNDWRMLLTHL